MLCRGGDYLIGNLKHLGGECLPYVRDIPVSGSPDLMRSERFDCQCRSVKRHELDFVGFAVTMHMDYDANVCSFQSRLGKRLGKNDG